MEASIIRLLDPEFSLCDKFDVAVIRLCLSLIYYGKKYLVSLIIYELNY